jgi:hypothetical protein
MQSIPPAYVAWRAGTSNMFVVSARQARNRFLGPLKCLQIQALCTATNRPLASLLQMYWSEDGDLMSPLIPRFNWPDV